ncbi:substrate-binding domain-containing protein [Nonomuraea dietziae]|uniref:substrate-binding domain-containing protein n=1 Tax=Nonomuraea dietziae TaxID=65515 RepID=UPI0031DFD119
MPEDLSVIGYDNTHLAGVHHISLTSVDQPRRTMGRSAAALLSDRIQDPARSPACARSHPS